MAPHTDRCPGHYAASTPSRGSIDPGIVVNAGIALVCLGPVVVVTVGQMVVSLGRWAMLCVVGHGSGFVNDDRHSASLPMDGEKILGDEDDAKEPVIANIGASSPSGPSGLGMVQGKDPTKGLSHI